MDIRQKIGSRTAKGGFKNEAKLVDKFTDYLNDKDAQLWLEIMGYDYTKIKGIKAIPLPVRLSKTAMVDLGVSQSGFETAQSFKKADLQIVLELQIDDYIYRENISAKKANKGAGFNQVDKRPVDSYVNMWNIPSDIAHNLKLFTGEIKHNLPNAKEDRRLYINELLANDIDKMLSFLNRNKTLIVTDIIKGRGAFAAEWMLVTEMSEDKEKYVLKDINSVCNFYAEGDVEVSPRGSLRIGRVTVQRKGGTPDPTSLQFKINPLSLFD